MDDTYTALAARAANLCQQGKVNGHRRVLIALAGPPGSGKTTIAAAVVSILNSQAGIPVAMSVPMDGFHLTRKQLDELPDRDLAYARRGAPWTFDADGVVDLVRRLSISRFEDCGVIYAPSFDHAIKDPVPNGVEIRDSIAIVILEGNYLLFDQDPWRQIPDLVDDTWFVHVDSEVVKERIAKRHILSGIEANWTAAITRVEHNDIPNGIAVCTKLLTPALFVQSIEMAKKGLSQK